MDGEPENLPDTANFEVARKIRHGIRRAMEELGSTLASAAVGREEAWSLQLTGRLDVLKEVFNHHVQVTEAPTGFLSEIVDRAPRLANAADKLRLEHALIAEALERALAAAQSVGNRPSDLEDARNSALELLHQLARHRQKGADIVYEAYHVDVEAGD